MVKCIRHGCDINICGCEKYPEDFSYPPKKEAPEKVGGAPESPALEALIKDYKLCMRPPEIEWDLVEAARAEATRRTVREVDVKACVDEIWLRTGLDAVTTRLEVESILTRHLSGVAGQGELGACLSDLKNEMAGTAKLEAENTQLRSHLKVAELALEKIASFQEGDIVTGSFDEPASAEEARDALKLIREGK